MNRSVDRGSDRARSYDPTAGQENHTLGQAVVADTIPETIRCLRQGREPDVLTAKQRVSGKGQPNPHRQAFGGKVVALLKQTVSSAMVNRR